MKDRELSELAAAEAIGLTVATLRNWRWRNVGPAYSKIGRTITYRQSDIDAWRLRQRREPAAS